MNAKLAITLSLALLCAGMAGAASTHAEDSAPITGGQQIRQPSRIRFNTDRPPSAMDAVQNQNHGTDANQSPNQAIGPDASRIEIPLDYFSNSPAAAPAAGSTPGTLNNGVVVPPQSAMVQRVAQRSASGVSAEQLQTYSALRLMRVEPGTDGKADVLPLSVFRPGEVLLVDARNVPRLGQRQANGVIISNPSYYSVVSGSTLYFVQSGISPDALRKASVPLTGREAALPGAKMTDTRANKVASTTKGKAVGIIAPEGWRTINVGQSTLSIDPNGLVRDVVPR